MTVCMRNTPTTVFIILCPTILVKLEYVFNFSDIRQIPDNQEVFAHPITDQSIIIEILEYVGSDDEEAIK